MASEAQYCTAEEFWADDVRAAHPASDFSKLQASKSALQQALITKAGLTPEQADQALDVLLDDFPTLRRYVSRVDTVIEQAGRRHALHADAVRPMAVAN